MKSSKLILACLCLAGTMPADAQPPTNSSGDVRTVNVNYADLDLATSAGGETLHKRVAAAAAQVCNIFPVTGMLQPIAQRTCITSATRDAFSQVDRVLAERRSATGVMAAR